MRFRRDRLQTVIAGSRVLILACAALTVCTVLFATHIRSHKQGAIMLPLTSSRAQAHARGRAAAAFALLPLSFEPNQGQADPAVRFLARGNGYALLLTRDEAVMTLDEEPGRQAASAFLQRLAPQQRARFERTKYFKLSPRFASFRRTESVRILLKGANPNAAVEALERLPGTSSYFVGQNPRSWRTGIPTYAKVKYEQVYPGVDLVYYGSRQSPEFDFVLAPGANPKSIDLLIDAKGSLHVAADGSVQLAGRRGIFELLRPRIYQTIAGKQQPIRGGFVLKAKNQLGIELAQYDPSRAVTIDPSLSYSTYFGGNNSNNTDEVDGIVVDSSGNMYVIGATTSTNLPTTPNGYSAVPPNEQVETFVSKLDPTGTTLLYSTYLGGSGSESAGGIAVDQNGNVYVAGSTTSPDFPVVNGFQAQLGGQPGAYTTNAFVARINTTLSGSASLVFSTYLGGGGNANNSAGDAALGIAIDGSGDAYVVGQTTSDASAPFPTTPNAYQSTLNSQNGNAFLTVVNTNASGTASLLYSTYLGGDAAALVGDYAIDVAVDSSKDVFLTGQTSSNSSGPFPTTPNAYQTSLHGTDGNIFVSEINTSLSGTAGLIYSTYLGGSDSNPGDSGDAAEGIALDTAGHAYITGTASSPDFPTTTGVFQTANSPVGKAIVAKLDTSQSGSASLVYSTFLGGSTLDVGNSVAVDSSGDAFVAGITASADFPTTAAAVQNTMLSPSYDGFFAEMNPEATALLYSTFFGGSCALGDSAYNITLDSTGNAYVTGQTCSTDFPISTGAYESSLQGIETGFIAKFALGLAPSFSLSAASGTTCPSGGNCSSSATVQAGQTATYNLQLEPLNGFSGDVTLRCSDTLMESNCAASPNSVTVNGNHASSLTVSVTTSQNTAAIPLSLPTIGSVSGRLLLAACLLFALALVLLVSMLTAKQSWRRAIPVLIVLFAGFIAVGGCAGGPTGAGTATRSGTVTVTATSSSGTSCSTSLTLTVK